MANLTGLATVGRGALAKPVGAMPEWATAQGAPGLERALALGRTVCSEFVAEASLAR